MNLFDLLFDYLNPHLRVHFAHPTKGKDLQSTHIRSHLPKIDPRSEIPSLTHPYRSFSFWHVRLVCDWRKFIDCHLIVWSRWKWKLLQINKNVMKSIVTYREESGGRRRESVLREWTDLMLLSERSRGLFEASASPSEEINCRPEWTGIKIKEW